jgi:hypothetical protein
MCLLIELLQHEFEEYGKMMMRRNPQSPLNVSGVGVSFRYCGEITGKSWLDDEGGKG